MGVIKSKSSMDCRVVLSEQPYGHIHHFLELPRAVKTLPYDLYKDFHFISPVYCVLFINYIMYAAPAQQCEFLKRHEIVVSGWIPVYA